MERPQICFPVCVTVKSIVTNFNLVCNSYYVNLCYKQWQLDTFDPNIPISTIPGLAPDSHLMHWLFLLVLLRTKPSYDSDMLSNLMLVINLLHQTAQGSIDSHIRHTNKKKEIHMPRSQHKNRDTMKEQGNMTPTPSHTHLYTCACALTNTSLVL